MIFIADRLFNILIVSIFINIYDDWRALFIPLDHLVKLPENPALALSYFHEFHYLFGADEKSFSLR